MERFQAVDAALTLAGVNMSDEQKVTLFTRGLKDTEDRLFVLKKLPANLKETYQVVLGYPEASSCPELSPNHSEQAEGSSALAGLEAE